MEIPYIVNPRKDTGLINSKIAIWLFLASEVMLFGGFFSAYVYLRLGADYPWPERTLPVLPGLINTFILIASSVTVVFAWVALKLGNWRQFQVYMSITVACAAIFMVLKGLEYNVKFHHQAARLNDYTVVEGHLGYELKEGADSHHPKESDYVLNHSGKKIEENMIRVVAEKVTFSVKRFHAPWVEEMLSEAKHPSQELMLLENAQVNLASDKPLIIFKKGEYLTMQTLQAAAQLISSNETELILMGDLKVENVALKEASEDKTKYKPEILLNTGDAVTMDWIKSIMMRLNLANIQLVADIKAVTEEGKKEVILAKAGTPLSLELLEKIKQIQLDALEHNSAVRTNALRLEWKEAKNANPDKRGWQLATDVNIDMEALKPRLLTEVSSVEFTVDPPTRLLFKPRDIKEAPTSSRLRDDTVILGAMEASPMVFHNLDAIDFQWLVMKAKEKGISPEAAIADSWLMKNSEFVRDAWAWHVARNEKRQADLTKDYGFKEDGKTPKRTLTHKELYRLGWKDLGELGVEKQKVQIGGFDKIKEEFMGPNYTARGDKTFPHLSVPREELRHAAKFTPAWNTYYAIYFTITGLHGLHVIGGALVLLYYLVFGRKMFLSNPEWLANRVEVGGLFWHFVDLVWIFAFPIFYLM